METVTFINVSISLPRGDEFFFNIADKETIQALKLRIQEQKEYHIKNQILMFCGMELDECKTLKYLRIGVGDALRFILTFDEQEMGLASDGKIEQRIYPDDEENLNQHTIKKAIRVFLAILKPSFQAPQ